MAIEHRVTTRSPAPDLARRLRRGTPGADAARPLDGRRARLRGRRGAQPPQRGRAVGDRPGGEGTDRRHHPAAEQDHAQRTQGPRAAVPPEPDAWCAGSGSRSRTRSQTLIDLATELKPLRLERAVNEADVHDLVDPETLRRSLDGYVGMPGVEDAADDARPAHVPALRLRPGDLLPAARARRRASRCR